MTVFIILGIVYVVVALVLLGMRAEADLAVKWPLAMLFVIVYKCCEWWYTPKG